VSSIAKLLGVSRATIYKYVLELRSLAVSGGSASWVTLPPATNCGETPAGLGRDGTGCPLLAHSNAFQ